MGTYGTTFITKGDKKIEFTDSYDGYFSAMGLHNLLSIKFMSDEVLNRLVDSFTDFEYKDYDDFEITDRNIQEALFKAKKDFGEDSPEYAWYKKQLENDIRPSVTGFGPILYLGLNPSYNDTGEPNYIIDLDKREFLYTAYLENPVFKLSFDEIRKTPESVLRYIGDTFENGSDFELVKNSNFEKIYNEFEELNCEQDLSDTDKAKMLSLLEQIQEEINAVLLVSPEVIFEYERKQKEEHQNYLDAHKQQQEDLIAQINGGSANSVDSNEENSVSSIHTIHSVTLPTLRKVIFYIQKLIEKNPEANYLVESTDWGINEDGATGGLRFLNPKNTKHNQLHEEILRTLENEFKLKMNIMVSTGSLGFFDNNEEDIKTEKSLYSLEEAQNINPEWKELIKEANPTLIYYLNYKDARKVALNNEIGHPNFNIPWVYAALINQDKELFEKVYPQLQNVSLTEEDKNIVYPSLLQSLTDGEKINKVMEVENNLEFTETIRSLGFFDDTKEKMTNAEKNKYFPQKPKSLKR